MTYQGLTYANSEAAFQAAKCTSDADKIQFTKLNPTLAKRLGRRVKLCEYWEAIKTQVMEEVVRAKFAQNAELTDKLLATGDAYLEEGTTWDRIWGVIRGVGENRLGIILMKVRAEIKESRSEK